MDDEWDIHELRDWVLRTIGPTIPASPVSPSPISPPPISPPLPPIDSASGDHSDVRQRVPVALAALDSVEAHITTLREFLKNVVDALRKDLEGTEPAPSMGRLEHIESELSRDGVPQHLIREILAIIKERDLTSTIAEKDELLKLADKLHTLVEHERRPNGLLGPQGDKKAASAFKYISHMEEALMRMQTEKPEALAAAIGIYKHLQPIYFDKPAIPYRLGWAYYRERKFSEALDQYTDARYLIQKTLTNRMPNGKDDKLTQKDDELSQMSQRLPRYIALIYWKLSEENEKPTKQRSNLITC
jgi:hypothetical protein